nr:heavy-metal-associated domain-containing protein [bacterium]
MSAVSSTDLASQQHPDQVRSDIAVDGMTCAACSNRIQRKLTRLDGV